MTTPCIEAYMSPGDTYPRVRIGKKLHYRHRLVWEQAHGPIPPGMYVCHHCDNHTCIRLDHLFLGTPSDNVQDAIAKGRAPQVTPWDMCKRGHPMSEASIVKHGDRGVSRVCLVCQRARHHARKES